MSGWGFVHLEVLILCMCSYLLFYDVSLHFNSKQIISQMSDHTWIQIALLGLMVYSVSASPSHCSFDAAFTIVDDEVAPASILDEFPDPQMSYFRDTLRFTEAETQQVVEAAIQHFNTQFGLDFSDIQPNDANQRILGNAMLYSTKTPFNVTAVANRWLVSGNRLSKCFQMGTGYIQVAFNDTMTLHGLYGGEDGRQVNAGDFLVYGYLVLFDSCPQQLVLIQAQTDIPARILAVEGWVVEDLRLYHRQLGRGRAHNSFKTRPSPDDPMMIVMLTQTVVSFP